MRSCLGLDAHQVTFQTYLRLVPQVRPSFGLTWVSAQGLPEPRLASKEGREPFGGLRPGSGAPGSSLSSGRILSSSSQIFRGSDNARSLVRAESQQILVTCNQQIRFRKSGALQKHIVARITAFLYRASNLHTDAARQNYLQRRCCPGLFPGELSVRTRTISASISSQVAI